MDAAPITPEQVELDLLINKLAFTCRSLHHGVARYLIRTAVTDRSTSLGVSELEYLSRAPTTPAADSEPVRDAINAYLTVVHPASTTAAAQDRRLFHTAITAITDWIEGCE